METFRVNTKVGTGNYECAQQKSDGGNHLQFVKDHNIRALGSKPQGSALGNKTYPTCSKCGKNHPSECIVGKEWCFGCD